MVTKFKVTVSWEYTISDTEAAETYGTTDPEAMAEIDQKNLLEDPGSVVAEIHEYPYTVTVEPVPAGGTS